MNKETDHTKAEEWTASIIRDTALIEDQHAFNGTGSSKKQQNF